ncbi:iron-containing alcohol dehydrogenase [Streptomyces chartreusis]|uniref:iron-containing alcohol dehydrogenase n=1 Tax=Streptomyces chartreusis TaxID=1969 RepID=UPI0036A84E6C
MNAVEPLQPAYTLTLRGPRVVYGTGVVHTELAAELNRLEAHRVLLVASPREQRARSGPLGQIADRIAGHVTDVRRHVPVDAVTSAITAARETGADCLLSIGGGSAVGTAKAVALETGLPIVALPTTYAGSELTPIYGLTDGGVKRTGRSERVLPRTVLLDPGLTADLPMDITRFSAVNALAHCLGGVFATDRSPVTDLLATRGARLLSDGLRLIRTRAAEPTAREYLTQGAHLAGTVLAHAGASLHHTLCHIIGGAFNLPHAQTHAAILPPALALLTEHHPDRAALLDDMPGGQDPASATKALLVEADAAVRLRDIGLAESDLPNATALLSNALTGMDGERAAQLLREAW